MRNPHGYGVLVSPVSHRVALDHFQCDVVREGTTEYDTVSCGHCNCHFHVMPGSRPEDLGGYCRLCCRVICPGCTGKACEPWLKKMEEMERRDYIRRQYEMVMAS